MVALNGFELIRSTSIQGEPFHSRFLAIALCASLDGDRSLFDGFWKLAAPPDWPVPEMATVHAERNAGERRRIDLCICDDERRHLLGIEVKTRSGSARATQLTDYEQGLVNKNQGWSVAIAYLTPFNPKRAGDAADSLPTVRFFEAFAKKSTRSAQHVSWLDVADLPWNGGDIWRQHQAYVRNTIASPDKLNPNVVHNRTFGAFFGERAEGEFWETLAELHVQPGDTVTRIKLKYYEGDLRELVRAFEVLIEEGSGVIRGDRSDRFAPELRKKFLESCHREIHAELFDLAARFENVWIEGKINYGVRVAHNCPKGSVSLVRSVGPEVLKIGEQR